MLVDEYQGSIWPERASLPRSLTVVGNDARYVGQCIHHLAARGCLPLGQFSAPPIMSAREGRHHRSRPQVLWLLAQERSVSSSFSVFAAGLRKLCKSQLQ